MLAAAIEDESSGDLCFAPLRFGFGAEGAMKVELPAASGIERAEDAQARGVDHPRFPVQHGPQARHFTSHPCVT